MTDTNTTRSGRRAAKEQRELRDLIRHVESKSEGSLLIKCLEWSSFYCTGHMKLNRHSSRCKIWEGGECDCFILNRTWVAVHKLPMFVQCSGCGYAPHDYMTQSVLLGRLLAKRKGKKIKNWWE
jgi:hypothetical protein